MIDRRPGIEVKWELSAQERASELPSFGNGRRMTLGICFWDAPRIVATEVGATSELSSALLNVWRHCRGSSTPHSAVGQPGGSALLSPASGRTVDP